MKFLVLHLLVLSYAHIAVNCEMKRVAEVQSLNEPNVVCDLCLSITTIIVFRGLLRLALFSSNNSSGRSENEMHFLVNKSHVKKDNSKTVQQGKKSKNKHTKLHRRLSYD